MKDALSEVSEKKALDAGTLFDWWNPRVLADFLGEDVDNLSMAWNGGSLVQCGIMPPGMPRSFAQLYTSVIAQVSQQLLSLHMAMGSSRKSAPAAARASCLFNSKASRRVSRRLVTSSSWVDS